MNRTIFYNHPPTEPTLDESENSSLATVLHDKNRKYKHLVFLGVYFTPIFDHESVVLISVPHSLSCMFYLLSLLMKLPAQDVIKFSRINQSFISVSVEVRKTFKTCRTVGYEE